MLPEGAQLNVIGPEGFKRTYVGREDPMLFPQPKQPWAPGPKGTFMITNQDLDKVHYAIRMAFTLVRHIAPPSRGMMYVPVEHSIGSAEQLEHELHELARDPRMFVELLAPNGDMLNLGIGGLRGSVAYATNMMIDEGRSLNAVGSEEADESRYVEFDAGGTLTPISERLLVDLPQLIAIAKHFFLNGNVPQNVAWE